MIGQLGTDGLFEVVLGTVLKYTGQSKMNRAG